MGLSKNKNRGKYKKKIRSKRSKKSKRSKRSKRTKRNKQDNTKNIEYPIILLSDHMNICKSSRLRKGGGIQTLTFDGDDGKIMCNTFNRLYKKTGNTDKLNSNSKMKIKILHQIKFKDRDELSTWVSNDTYWNKYKNHIKFMIQKEDGTYNLYIMERDAKYEQLIYMNDNIVHNPAYGITEDFV